MHLPPREQREHKLAHVRRLLQAEAVRWVQADTFRYRRRIRMRVDERGRPVFFNENKAEDCVVLTSGLVEAVDRVRGLSLDGASHVEVRAPDLDGQAGLFVAPKPGRDVTVPPLSAFATGRAWQRWAVTDGVWSYVPLRAFLQVNESVNRLLVNELLSGAQARGAITFVDAFAGAGNHALALASAGMRGVAGDIDTLALDALRQAAAAQALSIRCVAGAADRTCLAADADLLVANPPRAGLRAAAPTLAKLHTPHVALVACKAEALAHDVAAFVSYGYRLEEVIAFDMFAHTDHIELLAWLGRGD